MQAGGGDLFHDDWQACQKMIQRNSTGPPFFSRLVSLVEVRVVANKTVDVVRIEYTIVTFLAQDFVDAADALQLRIVWQLYVMPAVGFRECCVAQATHGVCSNVATSIEWLVVAQVC